MKPMHPIAVEKIVALLLLATTFTPAVAQTLPGVAQPGQVERQFQTLPEPRSQAGGAQIPEPNQMPVTDAAIKFTLQRVEITGASVYKPADLSRYYQPTLNKEVSLDDIYAIAAAITARYRNDGYILSQVLVPAQTIADGKVQLQVVEGYVAKVLVQTKGATPALVNVYANQITAARPLTAKVLERYLLLINDLPGGFARATLVASPNQPGASDLVLEFNQQKASFNFGLDNRTSESLGRRRLTASVEMNSLFGLQERTALTAISSGDSKMRYLALAHDLPVGSEGGKLSLTYANTRSEPDDQNNFIPLNLETRSDSGSLGYIYPLQRSRNANVYLRAGLRAHNGSTDIFATSESRDRIRAANLGLTYDLADAWRGINIIDIELSQGLDGLGASHAGDASLSRTNGKPDFSKLTLYAARLQSLASHWSLLAALNGQYAASDLLASELFSFGGEQFGRGYDPSELVGDDGLAAKLELRYTGGQTSAYTGYLFWDAGYVHQRTPAGGPSSEYAASAGIGLRLSLGKSVSGYLEMAKPLTRDVAAEGNREARAYAGLNLRF